MEEKEREEEEEIKIITDLVGDRSLEWLNQDYIPLPESSEREDSSDSSSEDSDYSL